MRVAPPVQALSCSAGPWWPIQLAWYALSAAVAAWWVGAHWWQPGAGPASLSLLLGLAAALVACLVMSAPTLRLGWDGSTWRLYPPGSSDQCDQVALMLDLGGWMLVRFTLDPAGWRERLDTTWLPLSRRDSVAAWPALRVALHSPEPAQPAA